MSEETQEKIKIIYDNLKELLIKKNELYGDSALHPIGIFSKASSNEQIKCRLDDKIMRIHNSQTLRKNDCVDIIGYLVLLCISENWLEFKDQVD